MGVTDWEPRALPSEARCKRWAELSGVWVSAADGFGSFRGKEHRAFYREPDRPMWRPWKDNNPATWSDFYAATHPPIPEGWGVVKEWELRLDNVIHNGGPAFLIKSDNHNGLWHSGDGYFCKVRRILPAIPAGWEAVGEWHDTLSPCSEVYDWTLLQDGRIVQRGETFRGKDERIMGVHIRRVLPAVDWGDVPREVALRPHGDTHIAVWKGCEMLGLIHQQPDCKWTARKVDGSGLYGNQPSDIAAIVALTGRRNE